MANIDLSAVYGKASASPADSADIDLSDVYASPKKKGPGLLDRIVAGVKQVPHMLAETGKDVLEAASQGGEAMAGGDPYNRPEHTPEQDARAYRGSATLASIPAAEIAGPAIGKIAGGALAKGVETGVLNPGARMAAERVAGGVAGGLTGQTTYNAMTHQPLTQGAPIAAGLGAVAGALHGGAAASSVTDMASPEARAAAAASTERPGLSPLPGVNATPTPQPQATEQPTPTPQPQMADQPTVADNAPVTGLDADVRRRVFGEAQHHPDLISRPNRLQYASDYIGRPIASFNDLTNDEAASLTNQLRMRRDALRLPAGTPEAAPSMILRTRQALDSTLGQYLADEAPLMTRIWQLGVTSARSALEQFGVGGTEMAQRIDASGNRALLQAAPQINALANVLRQLKSSDLGAHFFEVLERKAVPMNELERTGLDTWEQIRTSIANAAREVNLRVKDSRTGEMRDFIERADYVPHIYTDASIAKLTPTERQVLTQALGQGKWEQALARLKRFGQSYGAPEVLDKNLQTSRLFDMPGYERDARKVLPSYVLNAWNRIEAAREFGPEHESAVALLHQIQAETGKSNAAVASRIYGTSVGFRPWGDADLGSRASLYRNATVIQMLSPTAALKHASQLNNTIARVGIGPTFKAAVASLANPEMASYAKEVGTAIRDVISEIPGDESGPLAGAARKWTSLIGLRGPYGVVPANRMIATIAGRFWASDLASEFARTQNPRIGRQLLTLGIRPEDVVETGTLTPQQMRQASLQVMNDTQLMGRVLDLPALRNSEWGSILYLFKSAALQQASFVNRFVIRPARQGDVGPMVRFLAMTGTATVATGEAIRQYRALMSGTAADQKQAQGLQRYLEDVSFGASMGMTADALEAVANGDADRINELWMPVAASDATTVGQFTHAALFERNWKKATQIFLNRMVPSALGGRRLGKMVNPPQR
jgi:hypothetical protein